MSSNTDTGTGRSGFVTRHGLDSAERRDQAARVLALIEENNLTTLRLSFADQHGVLRGKSLVAGKAAPVLANGCTMTTSLLAKDTSHRTVFPVWQKGAGLGLADMQGAGDFIMVPDPATFRILPWAAAAGWMLCDIYFTGGAPVPFSTRQLLRDAAASLDEKGYRLVSGLEAEFHVFRVTGENLAPHQAGQPGIPPDVSLIAQGYQYLTEQRSDEIEPVSDMLRDMCEKLELPVRSMEAEFGPSQLEFTFDPAGPLATADNMMLFRSGVKQMCARRGLHATFMCRPHIANVFSSGWHLHQSLAGTETGENLFMPGETPGKAEPLSSLGLAYSGGLLAHARAAAVFTTPTINGYKRYQPHGLAPDRIGWGCDNKGAMVRAIGGPGDPATRIENRIGEPAANPYLFIASQIYAGMDGIANSTSPGKPTETPYDTNARRLPNSLGEAIAELDQSALYRSCFSDRFVDYLLTIKRAELARFEATVTDWEHREYFSLF